MFRRKDDALRLCSDGERQAVAAPPTVRQGTLTSVGPFSYIAEKHKYGEVQPEGGAWENGFEGTMMHNKLFKNKSATRNWSRGIKTQITYFPPSNEFDTIDLSYAFCGMEISPDLAHTVRFKVRPPRNSKKQGKKQGGGPKGHWEKRWRFINWRDS